MSNASAGHGEWPKLPSRDWWDKADIVSRFFSSVVIALVGILISYSIQNAQLISAQRNSDAQIAIAKISAQDAKRLQEGQLTAQLVQHLVSKEPLEREVAIIALRTYNPPELFEPILAAIAQRDTNIDVRARAIEQLSRSSSPHAAATLAQIAKDSSRPVSERTLAASSTLQVGVRQAIGAGFEEGSVFVLASAQANGQALDRGRSGYSPFAEAILKGLAGAADTNGDRLITGSELGRYVSDDVPQATLRRQQPIWLSKGSGDVILGPPLLLHKQSKRIVAIIVGVSAVPPFQRLTAVHRDVPALAALFQQAGAHTIVLLDSGSSKTSLRSAVDRIASGGPLDLFIFYYTGYGASRDGVTSWVVGESTDETLSTNDINDIMARIPAQSKALFVDSDYAGVLAR